MTKSVVNALIGILTQQGLVTPSMPAPIPEWRGDDDPRREIEVEHLMRMTTGLDLDETNSGFDPSSRMFYLHDDMAGLRRQCADRRAARHALGIIRARPRRSWRASSAMPSAGRSRRWRLRGANCSTRSACATSRWNSTPQARCRARPTCSQARATGRSSACSTSMTAWSAANASCMRTGWTSAPPRRSTPITPPASGPIAASTPTPRAACGSAFPRDAFFASGDLGQRIVIMPSQRLVVVRLGDSVDPTGDIRGLGRLVKEVIAAVQP